MRAFGLLLLATGGVLCAQSTTGTILGTIRDPAGAVLPGAKVRATDEGTGIFTDTETNAVGDYVVPKLRAALYGIRAEAPGVREARKENVRTLFQATVRT